MPSVLLITATVTPADDAPALKVRDPALRQVEYLEALTHYLRLSPELVSGIVFAESSSSDLTPFLDLAARMGVGSRFEALPVAGAPSHLGRGVGEARIIDQALRRSQLIAEAGDPMIWKVTGRYTVRNLANLIRSAPETDLYITLRRYPQPWCDTYAYAFTRSGYDRFLADIERELARSSRAGEPGEVIMSEVIESLIQKNAPITPRFRHEPRVDGVRGHDLASYSGPRQRLKYAIRVVVRRTLPAVWI